MEEYLAWELDLVHRIELDGTLHGGRAGYAAADFVGQAAQVAFERGGLQGGLDDAGRVVGLSGRSGGKTDCAQGEAQPQDFQLSHIGCIRNEILEKSKSS